MIEVESLALVGLEMGEILIVGVVIKNCDASVADSIDNSCQNGCFPGCGAPSYSDYDRFPGSSQRLTKASVRVFVVSSYSESLALYL